VVIEAVLDLNLAKVRDLADGTILKASIRHLSPTKLETCNIAAEAPDSFSSIEAQEDAPANLGVIKPLLNKLGHTPEDVAARAAEYGLHPNTVYG
jgi:hypothetical protein